MELTTTTTVFHTKGLDKTTAVAMAKALGLRRDWSRAKWHEIVAMLDAFPVTKLIETAQTLIPEYLSDAEMVELTDPENEFEDDDEGTGDASASAEQGYTEFKEVKSEPKAAPQSATQQDAVKTSTNAPDVNHVAAMLAQLMASNKASIDADDVRGIVAPMLSSQATMVLDAVNEALVKSDTSVRQLIDEAMKNVKPREIVVKSERAEVKIDGIQHYEFENLLRMCAGRTPDGHRMNQWLYGPPGTGKTTAARNVAKALGMAFYCNGALSSKSELTGFRDAGGNYQKTPFREAWENGGVYLFDEIDGSDPRVVVAFNSALANGIMAFPDGMVERHTDCVIIAASNTVYGANSQFTGRNKQDEASIDRFNFLNWEIDENVERAICPNASWVDYVQQFRRKIKDSGVKVQVTPRATLYGAALLEQGLSLDFVKRSVLRKAMTDEQWKLLQG